MPECMAENPSLKKDWDLGAPWARPDLLDLPRVAGRQPLVDAHNRPWEDWSANIPPPTLPFLLAGALLCSKTIHLASGGLVGEGRAPSLSRTLKSGASGPPDGLQLA